MCLVRTRGEGQDLLDTNRWIETRDSGEEVHHLLSVDYVEFACALCRAEECIQDVQSSDRALLQVIHGYGRDELHGWVCREEDDRVVVFFEGAEGGE
jgi:hypothetical protein